ncbi:MAG TPA: type II toxin-antitoxin system RelE/ParE family toxin [Candidatus Acidoferrales bacterium]
MRIFKNKAFARFARKSNLTDRKLSEVIAVVEQGATDVDLGGGVIKQRIARKGQGKSGGFRTIILYKRGSLAFFVYGFAKNERADISPDDLDGFKELASILLAYSEKEITAALASGAIVEVRCNEKE